MINSLIKRRTLLNLTIRKNRVGVGREGLLQAFLHNKTILPDTIYYILLIIVSFIGALYFVYRFMSIIMRDNMVYDEYDWKFDASKAPKASGSSGDPWITNINTGICVGEFCCSEGQVYDDTLNLCVIGTQKKTTTTTESFVNNVLTKTQPGKHNMNDVSLIDDYKGYK